MMRIDPVDLEWRRQLHVGDPIDAQNSFGNWCPAMIVRVCEPRGLERMSSLSIARILIVYAC
jgi:hypothetical protein